MGLFLGERISNKLHKNSFPKSHIFFCHSSCHDCENVVYYSGKNTYPISFFMEQENTYGT